MGLNPMFILAFAALALLVAAYFIVVTRRVAAAEKRDVWATVPWAGLFVALVYVSVAAFCIVAWLESSAAKHLLRSL